MIKELLKYLTIYAVALSLTSLGIIAGTLFYNSLTGLIVGGALGMILGSVSALLLMSFYGFFTDKEVN